MSLIPISEEEAMGIAAYVWVFWLLGLVNAIWFGLPLIWFLAAPLLLPLIVAVLFGLVVWAVLSLTIAESWIKGTWTIIKIIPHIPANIRMSFADTEEEGES